MKPVLAVEVLPGQHALTLEDVVEYLNEQVDGLNDSVGQTVASIRLIRSGEELRQYEAGELVLYRKPKSRRVGDRIVYEKDGQRFELEQERLNL